MLARLIEVWTDSVNERAYQPAFLQMLVAQGHHIVQSTRHGILEFGKDIITRDERGRLCAYQLKGHPGERLRKRDVAGMIVQLRELLFTHVQHPNVPANARHKAFLVTNGYVDEEALAELNALRAGLNRQTPATSFEVISRGDFLKWALELEGGLWPQGIDDWRRLLEILGKNGSEAFPNDLLVGLLSGIMGEATKRSDLKRKASSAAIFTALSLRSFSAKDNYMAEVSAWITFSTILLRSVERAGLNVKTIDPLIDVAEDAIHSSLARLIQEACSRPVPAAVAMDEIVSYHYRLPLLCGIAGLLSFWVEKTDADLLVKMRAFLEKYLLNCAVWGEGAIPSILMAIWAVGLTGALVSGEQKLISVANEVIARAQGYGSPLYGPYWSAEEIMIHNFASILRPSSDPLQDEDGRGESYFAAALLQLLARHNLKASSKALWPGFSKISCRQFKPATVAEYLAWHTEEGVNETVIPPKRRRWDDLLAESYSSGGDLPTTICARPFLMAAFCMLLPARCTTSAVRFLADRFGLSWKNGPGSLFLKAAA